MAISKNGTQRSVLSNTTWEKRMEIYQLNSFIAISETGSLTRAAKQNNISQSAMSSQIKALEDELGILLFTRQAKGMTLTPKGRELLKEARTVVQSSRKMKQKARDLQSTISGELNVGINTDPRFLQVSDISKRISREMPHLKISFIETQTFETCNFLLDEKIDVGFHYGRMEDSSIYSVALFFVAICAVLPIGMAKNNEHAGLEKIINLPWVWTRKECPFHAAFKRDLEKRNLELNQAADAVEENIVRELVKSGTGVALMRKDEAAELVREGAAIIWKGFELELPLGIACLEKRKTQSHISGFFEIMKEKYTI